MCRHIGYLGPAVEVGEILTRGTHSLRTQAWAPCDMRGGGTINVDGFGVAWWIAEGSVSRYRNAAPIWTDPAVDEVLPQLSSTAVLGAVRSATVGMPVERSANAPFTHGRWAFSHNGRIPGWLEVLSAVAAEFGSPALLDAESRTDAATLWVIARGLLEPAVSGTAATGISPLPADRSRSAGAGDDNPHTAPRSDGHAGTRIAEPRTWSADPALILPQVIRAVLDRSPESRLNLLLGDGETLWATTVYHSLSVLVTDEMAVVASEPYDDDPRWRAVADRQMVTLRPGHLSIVPLYADERAQS